MQFALCYEPAAFAAGASRSKLSITTLEGCITLLMAVDEVRGLPHWCFFKMWVPLPATNPRDMGVKRGLEDWVGSQNS